MFGGGLLWCLCRWWRSQKNNAPSSLESSLSRLYLLLSSSFCFFFFLFFSSIFFLLFPIFPQGSLCQNYRHFVKASRKDSEGSLTLWCRSKLICQGDLSIQSPIARDRSFFVKNAFMCSCASNNTAEGQLREPEGTTFVLSICSWCPEIVLLHAFEETIRVTIMRIRGPL